MEENNTMNNDIGIVDETKKIINTSNELLSKYEEVYNETKEDFDSLDGKIFDLKISFITTTSKEIEDVMKKEKYLAQIETDINVKKEKTNINTNKNKIKKLSLYFGKARSLIDSFFYSFLIIIGFLSLATFTQNLSFVNKQLEDVINNLLLTVSFYSFNLVSSDSQVMVGMIVLICIFLISFIIIYQLGIFTRKISNSKKAKSHRIKVDEFLNEELINNEKTSVAKKLLNRELDSLKKLQLLLNEKLYSIKRIKSLEKISKLSESQYDSSKNIINQFNRLIEVFNKVNINEKVLNENGGINDKYVIQVTMLETKISTY